jgi:hypothetical protein
VEQLTRDEAIALYESGVWKKWPNEQTARFQLYQECLCVPFDKFQEAIEEELGRPVLTHEFAFVERLKEEYEGKRGKPTFEEIMGLIPEEKRIIFKPRK